MKSGFPGNIFISSVVWVHEGVNECLERQAISNLTLRFAFINAEGAQVEVSFSFQANGQPLKYSPAGAEIEPVNETFSS
jgi:hypothetical protein